jgi:hypothetical protein
VAGFRVISPQELANDLRTGRRDYSEVWLEFKTADGHSIYLSKTIEEFVRGFNRARNLNETEGEEGWIETFREDSDRIYCDLTHLTVVSYDITKRVGPNGRVIVHNTGANFRLLVALPLTTPIIPPNNQPSTSRGFTGPPVGTSLVDLFQRYRNINLEQHDVIETPIYRPDPRLYNERGDSGSFIDDKVPLEFIRKYEYLYRYGFHGEISSLVEEMNHFGRINCFVLAMIIINLEHQCLRLNHSIMIWYAHFLSL